MKGKKVSLYKIKKNSSGSGRGALKEGGDTQSPEQHDFSDEILRQAIVEFRKLRVKIRDIFWFAGFWQIVIHDGRRNV